ncbi:MAG: hypothetical protein H6806_13090 [Planctomycetes bacterium]|nr:hypothetical protein [Planctomycetota bacterium]MCB9825518.1 hypothetical protein [Planctomycetota bacterium]MCB9830680.1 hypothetical protein [Planctomycetota bacterium]MCB9900612.1 hypothetical protein [Planctomycetota bacterium]
MLVVLVGFVGGLVLLAPVIGLAPRLGLVDNPTARSSHVARTPRVGGFALVGALLAAAVQLALTDGTLPPDRELLAFTLPALGFFLLGLVDDRWRLGARPKAAVQAALAAGAVAMGWRFAGEASPGFAALGFGVLDPFMAWLWIVAVVTAVNFLDGIDLITCAVQVTPLALAASAGAGLAGGTLYAALLGGVLVLGVFNITPARTFPGDAATHLLGFAVALMPMRLAGAADLHPLPWAWAAAPLLPAVIDIGLGLVIKRRRGLRWSAAHREHLHQRLTRAGWSHVGSALRYGVLTSVAALFAVVLVPRLGWWVAGPLAALVLLLHLQHAARRTRHVAWASAPAQNG